ncbi:MAG: metalloregulator ArsR/SmtB family transcription factor [Gemmatimonadetes bacterium]|nr:metalloregulator ArsR/SmtB family transcription factor [Gemmatimonadota bacterium]
MVKSSSDECLSAVFSALSDTTRRAVLTRLAARPRTVTELARPFDMSLPGVSKHLRVLQDAGLIHKERDGRLHRCCSDVATLETANDWLAQFARCREGSFDALERYLTRDDETDDH